MTQRRTTTSASRSTSRKAISEFREVLRLNPKNEGAHVMLGLVLTGKGDLDGAISEYREALRLNPNYPLAHDILGSELERKGDKRGALEEYRTAYALDPKNATYKQNYERLSQQVNQR
jgi:Flp pilus assembly protein TadD